jgi:hypothetical protein
MFTQNVLINRGKYASSYHHVFPHVNSGPGLGLSFPDSLPPYMIRSIPQLVGSGHMSMRMPIRVTILSREDCHLCEVVYRIATCLQSELHIEANKVSIESDRVLMECYGTRVPVVLLDEVEYFAGNVTEEDLRRAIKRARWRRPISRILSRLGYAPKRG